MQQFFPLDHRSRPDQVANEYNFSETNFNKLIQMPFCLSPTINSIDSKSSLFNSVPTNALKIQGHPFFVKIIIRNIKLSTMNNNIRLILHLTDLLLIVTAIHPSSKPPQMCYCSDCCPQYINIFPLPQLLL